MTNEQLALRVKNGIDPAANMLALWQQNTALIRKIAKRYQGMAELEDLEQEGYIGLCNAVNGYDPDSGAFSSYAVFWIREAMMRYIDNSGAVRVPVHMCQRIRDYNKTGDILYQEYGRKPSDDEIRQVMGLTTKEYDNLKRGLSAVNLESLDRPVKADEDGEITLLDTIPGGQDPADLATDQRHQEELECCLWDMVDQLPEDKSCVILQRYREGLQLNEIADKECLTLWQVTGRIRNGIREMRKPQNRKKLVSYLPDRFHSEAYHGSTARFNQTWTSSTERIAMKLAEPS